MTRTAWRAGLLAVALVAPAAHAADDAWGWVERMSGALTRLEFEGELVYIHDDTVETLGVERSIGAQGPRDRLVTLSGDRREIVREGNSIRCTTANGLTMEVETLPGPLLGLDAQGLASAAARYSLRVAGADRVAGRDTVVLDAQPHDAERYGYRLWVDRESGLPLASALQSRDGTPIERMMFTSVTIRDRAAVASTAAPADAAAPAAPAVPAELADWRVSWLPAGFRLVATPHTNSGPRHLLYSDGLANVSVYIEPLATSGSPLVASLTRGAVYLDGRTAAGHQIVVVGDLPAPSIQRIAGSVEPR